MSDIMKEKTGFNEFSKENQARPFQTLKQEIEDQAKKAAQEFVSTELESRFAKLNHLRENGLFLERKLEEEEHKLKANHKYELLNDKIAYKHQKECDKRETKRRKTELNFNIKEQKAVYDEKKAEAKRDHRNIIRLSKSIDFKKGSLVEKFEELILDYHSLRVGYMSLKALPSIQEIEEEAKKQIEGITLEEKQRGLTEEEKALKKKAKVSAILFLKNQKEKLKSQFDKVNSLSENGLTFIEFTKEISSLCMKAFLLDSKQALYAFKFAKRADRKSIHLDYQFDAQQKKKDYEAKVEALENDAQYLHSLEEIHNRMKEAQENQKANESEITALQEEALALSNQHFNALLELANQNRKEVLCLLKGKNTPEQKEACERLKNGSLTQMMTSNVSSFDEVKEVAKQIQSEKGEAVKKDDAALKLIATAAVRPSIIKKLQARVNDDIRARFERSKVNTFEYDSEIRSYYSKDDVIKDPSLVNTKAMRLVINVSKKESGDVKRIERADRIRHFVSLFFIYLLLVIFSIIVIFPFYWMINTSLKSTEEIIGSLTPTFWPETVMWSNYGASLFQQFDFGNYLLNTLVVGICSTIGVLLTCIFSAFAFARLKFKGRDTMFMVFLATMMIPGEMMVLTNYITVANFGWVGTQATRGDAYLAMIVPFLTSVFYIYLLRQNFKQIPEELYLAAKVDGKSDWAFLWKVMVPLCKPTLITIGILELMGSWNAYVWPNLVSSQQQYRLISNGLRSSFTTATGYNETGLQMAATVYVTLPLLLMFICFRKYIMKGVGRAGIKG